MNNNIYIPKRINVGYQNRKDTYTGKIAYVIYYDEKGKLRKEVSWNGWRDENIPNTEFDNVPTDGFVLNKPAGGKEYSYGWDVRKSYCRVYDPRDFEFEITIENLLYILANCSCVKGKGLEGKFVYGWDGKELILMSVDSPDYKEISAFSDQVNNRQDIKAKDLIIGATYLTKDNEEWIYMGKYDTYDNYCYTRDDIKEVFPTYSALHKWCQKQGIVYDSNYSYCGYKYKYTIGCVGKQFWFYTGDSHYRPFMHQKSFPKNKIICCSDDTCSEKYADLFYKMEGDRGYSPYDPLKDEYEQWDIDDFKHEAGTQYWFKFISKYKGEYNTFELHQDGSGKYTISEGYIDGGNTYFKGSDLFPCEETSYYGKRMIPVTLEEIYEKMHPEYIKMYLKNGREYETRGTLYE